MARGFGSDRQVSANSGENIGAVPDDVVVVLRIGGELKGPVLLVCGREPICRPIFKKIITLPSLPWLSGTLMLGYIGDFEGTGHSAYECEPFRNPTFDESLFLDFHENGGRSHARYCQHAYWAILRKMTQIGMISGRGVPMP
ncbi:MAG TPA: hypothetical protein VLA52_10095 [Thermohalobaculum sp.]|nr:hypothetical protein [Thermohalobaculum sp.]